MIACRCGKRHPGCFSKLFFSRGYCWCEPARVPSKMSKRNRRKVGGNRPNSTMHNISSVPAAIGTIVGAIESSIHALSHCGLALWIARPEYLRLGRLGPSRRSPKLLALAAFFRPWGDSDILASTGSISIIPGAIESSRDALSHCGYILWLSWPGFLRLGRFSNPRRFPKVSAFFTRPGKVLLSFVSRVNRIKGKKWRSR